ncbi:MAG: hypothetical protein WC055_09965 [Melioribacteraceae bacterium]
MKKKIIFTAIALGAILGIIISIIISINRSVHNKPNKYYQYCGYVNGDTTKQINTAVINISDNIAVIDLQEISQSSSYFHYKINIHSVLSRTGDSIYTKKDSNIYCTTIQILKFKKDFIYFKSINHTKVRYGAYNQRIKIDSDTFNWVGKYYMDMTQDFLKHK